MHQHRASLRRPKLLLLIACLAIVGGLVAFVVLAPASPLRHELARLRWQSSAPPHYQIEVHYRSGGYVAHALLEVRDEQIVSGTDLLHNRPMNQIEIGMLRYNFPVERLFHALDDLNQWPVTWRGRLSRLVPTLAYQLDPCYTRQPSVRYDPYYGYPAEVRVYTNPCFNGIGYRVGIERLTPLP
ncbi:MAG: DUF6174 domain-containing protein [Chloroflexaceae bacterium]|jgi:hypothetical protein|nr:DUF6174 domain-containing protein [Chloroflexaceae bacterium]